MDDAELNFWGMPFGKSGQPLSMPGPLRNDSRSSELHDRDFVGPVRLEPMRYVSDDQDWRIVVRHRKGSVEAAVAGLRRRNLAVSFGVLVVLAMTMALVVITADRARRLARLQMDFVAGVSHELRTPLAVISSAAENIADGVVENKQQIVKYGTVIRNQARQLTHLVEQVLLFASTRHTRHNFNAHPVVVGEVIEAAIESTASLVSSAQFTIEQRIEPGLPPVMADFSALLQCLQNLITNAVKYGGGESRWIGISARAQKAGDGRNEVSVTVQDRGIGIDRAEMQHIFEPFYRSPSIAGSRIHGSGLGLALVQRTTEAMSGRLTADSEVGKGSSFTIHLSAAPSGAEVGDPNQIKALTNSPDAVR
jgi:signal transduction histidine kinase